MEVGGLVVLSVAGVLPPPVVVELGSVVTSIDVVDPVPPGCKLRIS